MLGRRIFLAGIVAGLVAGVFITAIQAVKIAPLIEAAEVYERADASRHAATPDAHDQMGGMQMDAAEWEPAEGIERLGFTLVANMLVGVAYGLFLSVGIAVRSAIAGTRSSAMNGIAWGIAGFAVFQLAPSFGLPPEPPGTVAAALLARQSWWLGTALATAAGLALVVFQKNRALQLLGIVAIAVPHLIGAPQPPPSNGSLPAQIAAEFVAASLGTAALFWLVLGGGVGWLYGRLGRPT
jgi:cobalt transporter subunit CbtA